MSEYVSGLTMGQCAEFDKERVRHALRGELMCGEDESGFVYEAAPRQECDRYVLGVIDKWYFTAKQLADSGKAMERIMAGHGMRVDMWEYMAELNMAEQERDGYVYEHQLDELRDEIDIIEKGMDA